MKGPFGVLEKESAFNVDKQPHYPFNHVTQTESGHIFELDDTPKRERVKLMHRTGTYIEMAPDGDEVHKIFGNGLEITVKDKDVIVKGSCSLTVYGDCVTHIMGDKFEKVEGDYSLFVMGNYYQRVKKETEIYSEKKMNLVVDPNFTGELNISVGTSLNINGEVDIQGSMQTDNIFATGRIDAALGMGAGPYGFVTMTGGFSAGLAPAIPGCCTVVGMVNAGISVNSPLGMWFLSNAIHMFDIVNVSINNIHFHDAPRGPTSPPLIPMV